ncbi:MULTISPECIES: beta-ketoacyl synthase chain length factor [Aeromonas]|uniref:beta-ketoacyl synthase chain length factor n=1 Tax=Aeromonas TaxID=642 RepID=UPI001118E221|nr:beta-ketoacyl synthase chain length factor [Aeromonas dhakensis]TNI59868.1 beta-ketoacyl synthase [Aeromonas dhakensis]WAG01011.1 beta-ketoacyl synthase chain length factor [Aeromonas dhakensis]
MLSFSLLDSQALSPGLADEDAWQAWAQQGRWPVDPPFPVTPLLPMMMARRLSQGARLAVQVGLSLLARHQVDSAIFVSRHGELARSMALLQALADGQALSPTDFSMSVHNTAAGLCSIQGKAAIPMSSLAAGENSLMAGLTEAVGALKAGARKVLLVAFEGPVPEFHRPWLAEEAPPHALGLVLEGGEQWCCEGVSPAVDAARPLPQSLALWRALLLGEPTLILCDDRQAWRWQRC